MARLINILGLTAASLALSAANPDTYEYIVVGSGPGGGPLAANLARSGYSVLLIEAGNDQFDNENSRIVYNNTGAINDERTTWDFFVSRDTPDIDSEYLFTTWRQADGEYYVGLDPPEGAERLGVYYPRGGTLGGSAMINAASLALPADVDWQMIADITGDDAWTYENMRKHFIRLERNNYLPNGSDPTHGFNGYIYTSQEHPDWARNQSHLATLATLFSEALGDDTSTTTLYDLLARDINAYDPERDQTVGVYTPHSHSREGVRSSPLNYIRATLASGRTYPLTVLQDTLATKVLFAEANPQDMPKAIGVEYLQGRSVYAADRRRQANSTGVPGRAFASKEVIISGGVFNSPQLLKLSGIGPAAELTDLGLPVVKDLPGVGMNLKDNYEAALYGTFSSPVTGFFDMFYQTSVALYGRDIQFYCGSMMFIGFWPGMPGWNENQFECGFMQLHPRNMNGTVKLRSTDPTDTPDIHLGYFQQGNDDDLESIVEAINFARDRFREINGTVFTEFRPCAVGVDCTDDWQRSYLRGQTWSHHASGTCSIGPDDDPFAVLDSQFRVRGVDNLRVVDASSFPVQPGAVPVLATFIIGEKAYTDIVSQARAKE
ncbi:hypothetical protein NM208_g5440 [Fusarium decemcellulare]|uniref:Uncharacterized protein n=1 Tax=Fusarium decemcellulare TaxID=57161 RepID=A0ACC1SGX9_9HYPO|nr:hypothetical protein NM208_g5440 [Fusarium decemcellulare]